MKSPFGFRLWLLIASLALVAGAMLYGFSFGLRRIHDLEAKFTASRLESFQLSSQVHRALLDLNNSLLRYTVLRDPRVWHQFDTASKKLDHWIDHYDPSLNPASPLTTQREKLAFEALNRAYDGYLAAARAVHTNQQPALVTPAQFSQLKEFDAQEKHMQDLVQELTSAHRLAQTAFLADTNAVLAKLRAFLTAEVVIILLLVGALGWVIYRDAIAPLRGRLVQSQSLLEKREKLAVLGTLAAGIAHEIRNPLTSLKARLYTLEKHLQELPAARKDTEIIGAEILRLERIVQDVLSFARPSEPRRETLSVQTVLKEVQGLMAPNLESRRVHLTLEAGPALIVQADSGHLKQVLVNLVRNAAEAIDAPGVVTLRVRAGRATFGGHEAEAAIIEVSDTGRGILPEVEKRLFDPFFSTKETGTGLGLSIVAQIVEKQGGALRYQTHVGHGTTFGVVLPLLENGKAAST